MKLISITADNLALLEDFIKNIGNSKETFRYFETRSFEALNNHLCTYLLLLDEVPIGYGHLDKEDDKVWLGIALNENHKGKGFGALIIDHLLVFANNSKLKIIHLSVDKQNTSAVKLYLKKGFICILQNETKSIYKIEL